MSYRQTMAGIEASRRRLLAQQVVDYKELTELHKVENARLKAELRAVKAQHNDLLAKISVYLLTYTDEAFDALQETMFGITGAIEQAKESEEG